jgi:DNA-binding MarR family transcriptional regulator
MSRDEQPYPGLTKPMIGALLREAYEATHRLLFTRLHEAGFADLRDSHFALFKFPGPHGVHPTELADRVGLSKQALNPLLNELEALGYLTRQADGGDRRQRVVLLTDRGFAFAAEIKAILEDIEAHLAAALGPRRFAAFRSVVAQVPDLIVHPNQQAPVLQTGSGR